MGLHTDPRHCQGSNPEPQRTEMSAFPMKPGRGNTGTLQAASHFDYQQLPWLSLQIVFISTKKQFLFLFNHGLKVTMYGVLGAPRILA